MELTILVIISIIQSIIGVGVLLFGTPIFLLLGYSFFETLVLLLPISIIISVMTVFQNRNVDIDKTSLFLLLSSIVIGTYFAVEKIQNISLLIISIILLATFIFNLFSLNQKNSFYKNKNFSFSFIGLLHGVSNQGGALLLWFFSNTYDDKSSIRSNVALAYGLMASFQLITLIFIDFTKIINIINFGNIIIPLISFLVGSIIFKSFSADLFKKLVNIFIGIFGILLLYKFLIS